MIKVKKHLEDSFEIALRQGFGVNVYQCAPDEMWLSLPNEDETLEYAKHRGWEIIQEQTK